MYLDVKLAVYREYPVFERRLATNLAEMAKEVGIYRYLWEPETAGILRAKDLIRPLSDALAKMKADPEYLKQFEDKETGVTYNSLFFFLRSYLDACREYPMAKVATWK